ncbi:glycoside hydrolase family 32 protein [Paenibacillus sp. JSM ZJ436]|uniref:glycoside hydrolase family 32 protein n=1 Tax=Paenibacillus sp. JSM ZJ436 TaxID=3376190 RepID=UPI00378DBC9E
MKHHTEHPLRPQYHFTPPANWMNDPNGMVYFEGEYHLFYQYHPDSTVWGPMHWGHAVSRDLVHWEHLPIALFPDQNGAIFSGSAVVDWNDTSGFFNGGSGLVAIYTQADSAGQRQSIAYSKDSGRTWIPYTGNPVLIDERFPDFRDPKVFWHESSNSWVMVLAAGNRLFLYRSPDLKSWTFASEFGAQEGSHDGVWECPDLFELSVEGENGASRWVTIVSIGDDPACSEGSRTQYFVGSFDGTTFTNENTPDTVLWLDYGRDNYAGVTWSDAPGNKSERLFIGWMNNWKYANLIPTGDWRGAMTLVRKLSLKKETQGVRLIQKELDGYQQLRLQGIESSGETLSAEGIQFTGMSGLLEIEAEFDLMLAAEIGLRFTSGDKKTVVGYDVASAELFIDRTDSGHTDFHEDFACRHSAPLEAKEGRVKMHIWLDRSSIEVFADEGGLVVTDQLFPVSETDGVELYAVGGEAMLRTLRVYPLRSVYTSVAAQAVSR